MGDNTHISRDDALSLSVRTGCGNTYGVTFRGYSRRCAAAEDCTAVITDAGVAAGPHPWSVVADHQHVPSFPIGAPRPGPVGAQLLTPWEVPRRTSRPPNGP